MCEGSGMELRPRWVVPKPGAPPVEGCRVVLQMNVNLFMHSIPTPMMNFVFKVRCTCTYVLRMHRTCVRNLQ